MKDNRFPSKEYLENEKIMSFYHNFEDPSIFKNDCCKECKGYCCKKCGCAYYVEDFEDLSFESLKKELEKETISITSVIEMDKIHGQMINNPVLFLRVRNRKRGIIDLFSEKTRCSLLTPDGCPYSLEERPLGAMMLLPKKDHDTLACETLKEVNDITIENWKKHQEVLKRLENEKKRLEAEVARGEKMLSNPGFIEKAPEKKITEEKSKLANYKELLENVIQKLEKM